VFYEDGELVKEQRLYDDDFGDELWKFDTPLSNLIKAMKDEIEALQEENETDSNYDPDDDDDDDDTQSECSDTSITDTKEGRPSIGDVLRGVIVHTSLITFASLAALRVLKGGCSDGIFPNAICSRIV
jgi:hypothetical protein